MKVCLSEKRVERVKCRSLQTTAFTFCQRKYLKFFCRSQNAKIDCSHHLRCISSTRISHLFSLPAARKELLKSRLVPRHNVTITSSMIAPTGLDSRTSSMPQTQCIRVILSCSSRPWTDSVVKPIDCSCTLPGPIPTMGLLMGFQKSLSC